MVSSLEALLRALLAARPFEVRGWWAFCNPLRVFNRLDPESWVSFCTSTEDPAPQGLQNSAQGFNPKKPSKQTVCTDEGARDAGLD